jgi:AbrB family looped-hinge helix DNA binding protein
MRELRSTLTSKGQVTIPVEVRRLLGLEPHDKVAFVVDDGQVRVERARSVAERTAGIFKSDLPPLSAEEMRRVAEELWAEAAEERSR